MAIHDLLVFFSAQHISELLAQSGLWGLAIIALIIFCETGLVVAPFLPGDSLIFTLGAFIAGSHFSPVLAVAVMVVAAFAGDSLNYCLGRSAFGQWVINKRLLKPQHAARTRLYFEKYGTATIFIGRFIPVVRTLAPFLAGTGQMPAGKFLLWNFTGGFSWCLFFISMGYWLGSVAWVQAHMELMAMIIIILSLFPVGLQIVRQAIR